MELKANQLLARDKALVDWGFLQALGLFNVPIVDHHEDDQLI